MKKHLKLVSSKSKDFMYLKKIIDELKPHEIQKMTLLYAHLKDRNYTKFHKDSKYINPNNQ